MRRRRRTCTGLAESRPHLSVLLRIIIAAADVQLLPLYRLEGDDLEGTYLDRLPPTSERGACAMS